MALSKPPEPSRPAPPCRAGRAFQADGSSSLSEAVPTYPRLGKVVRGATTLSDAAQAWQAARQTSLPENKFDGRKLGLSTTRQAYPQPANVSGRLDKLIHGKTTLSAFRQGCQRQDNVVRSRDNVIRGKSRLPAGKQGCFAADKLVCLPTSLLRASPVHSSGLSR
jgi:hypothetical protein